MSTNYAFWSDSKTVFPDQEALHSYVSSGDKKCNDKLSLYKMKRKMLDKGKIFPHYIVGTMQDAILVLHLKAWERRITLAKTANQRR